MMGWQTSANVPRLMRSDGKRSEAEFDGISHRRCYPKCRGAKRSGTKENSDGGAARYPKWSGATFWITAGTTTLAHWVVAVLGLGE